MVQEKQEICVDATLDRLQDVFAFLNEILEANKCPLKIQMQIEVSVEEIFVNIAQYAYKSEKGKVDIAVTFIEKTGILSITFSDWGIPYNPLEKEDPNVTLSAEERNIGGLGIFLVKKNMDAVNYCYQDEKNILAIQKKINF